MKTSFFLAIKNITGNKQKSAFVVAIISIVLAMTLIVTIVKENIISYNVQSIQTEKGSWHCIVPISDNKTITEISALEFVSSAAGIRRTLILEDEAEMYDCYLVDVKGINLLINPNISGELPQGKGEVLVPDWFLEKYSIKAFPHQLQICGVDLIITGSYLSSLADSTNERVKLYFCSTEITELFNENTYTSSPLDTIISSSDETYFGFVRLIPNTDPYEAIEKIKKVNGVSSFPILDSSSELLSSGVIVNSKLLDAEGYNIRQNYDSNFISDHLSEIITAILLLVLFIAIFVAMNLIISSDTRFCGIIRALGLPKEKLRPIFVIQALLLSIISVPLGSSIGIGGAYFLLKNSLSKIYGSFVFPYLSIIFCIFACVVFVALASLYPASKASNVSCVEAISNTSRSKRRGANCFFSHLPMRSKGKVSFAFQYAIRNALFNIKRILFLIVIIALILAIFINLSCEIEKIWKEGHRRQFYRSDYTIKTVGSQFDPDFIEPTVLEQLSTVENIEKLYCQRSIYDYDPGLVAPGTYFSYYFILDKQIVTDQGYKQLALSSPVTRSGYPDNLFVQAGISGYGEDELKLAMNCLIEGDVTIEQMKSENIILLPKYIQWIENVDIPYTQLQVGDQITLVENISTSLLEIDITKEYTFTIGGFVDNLPLPQVNGVSNGFVAIMYQDKLEQLTTEHKGIAEIYVDGGTPDDIEKLCELNKLDFIDNTSDYIRQEQDQIIKWLEFSIYAIFAVLSAVIFLTIFNILLSDIALRTSEYSLLYIMGVYSWQRNLAILLEMLFFTIPGILGGVVGGILFIALGDMSDEILSLKQLIPTTHIVASSGIILMAAVFSALLGIAYTNKSVSVNITQE